MDTSCVVGIEPELSSRSALQILRGLAWNRSGSTLRDALVEASTPSGPSGFRSTFA